MATAPTRHLLELQARCPQESSLWRHKKSGWLYRVAGSAINEIDCVPLVLYRRAVIDHMPTWARPLDEFLQKFEQENPS